MARRDENECAHCAETLDVNVRCLGADWKVYCSPACQQAGEQQSVLESTRWLACVTERHAPNTCATYASA